MAEFFKKAIEAIATPKSELIPGIIKNLGKEYPERSHKVVHASDVTKPGFCPRQYALMDLHNVERPPTYIPAGLKATFDVGNMTSDLVREQWMGSMAVGHWQCTACYKTSIMSPKPHIGICSEPSGCNWKYVEVNFVDPDTQISGSIDVLSDLKAPSLFITELKIINPTEFDKIVAPLAEHRIRTILYMYLAEKSKALYSGAISHHRAKILYVSRGFGKKGELGQITPFKEFDITRDDKVLQPYLAKAREVALYRKGQAPVPARTVCDSPSCVHAKKCPVRAQCFEEAP